MHIFSPVNCKQKLTHEQLKHETLKQDLVKPHELKFQSNSMTIMLLSPKPKGELTPIVIIVRLASSSRGDESNKRFFRRM